jgi:hypothetical protein
MANTFRYATTNSLHYWSTSCCNLTAHKVFLYWYGVKKLKLNHSLDRILSVISDALEWWARVTINNWLWHRIFLTMPMSGDFYVIKKYHIYCYFYHEKCHDISLFLLSWFFTILLYNSTVVRPKACLHAVDCWQETMRVSRESNN